MSSWITKISSTAWFTNAARASFPLFLQPFSSRRFANGHPTASCAQRQRLPQNVHMTGGRMQQRCAISIIAGGLLMGTLASSQPAYSQNIFENVTIRPRFSPDPMTIRGISGGAVPANSVAGRKETPTGPCVGFVDEPPDHTLVLTSFFNYLSLKVESPQDTTLVVSGPGGTWCNDDFQGKNPGIAGQWQAGTYRVWIGSYDKNNYHPYIIRMSAVQLLNPAPR